VQADADAVPFWPHFGATVGQGTKEVMTVEIWANVTI